MRSELYRQIEASVGKSDAAARRHWAKQIIESETPLIELIPLLHAESNTAQKFTWTIGDVCEREPALVAECIPMLFELRDEMTFPGMDRSVSKWLWLTGIPESVETDAIPQLLDWFGNDSASIACKSYSAKALFDLVQGGRVSREEFEMLLEQQTRNANKSFAARMKKLLRELRAL